MKSTLAAVFRAAGRARLVAVLAVALPVLFSGCKKNPYLDTVKQTPYLGLPQNLDHVASLDMNRLRSREVFKDALAGATQSAAEKARIEKLRKGLGYDPINDVNLIIMGTRGKFQNVENPYADSVFIMRGNFSDPAAKLDTMRNYLAEEYLIAPPPFKESTHPNTEYKTFSTSAKSQYNEKATYSLNFGFPSGDMMVFAFSPGLLGETLDTISGGTPGLGADKAWLQMLGRPAIGAIVWGTGRFDPAVAGAAAQANPSLALGNIDQYYFSLDSTSRIEAHLGLVCKTIENAVSLSEQIKQAIPEMQKVTALFAPALPETSKLPGKLTVLPKGQTVDILLPLTDEESRAIRDELRKFSSGPGAAGFPGMLPGGAPR